MKLLKVLIKGEKRPSRVQSYSSDELVELEASYIMTGSIRGVAEMHEITLDENKLLEIVFEDDTHWFCDADTLDEVYPEATQQSRSENGQFVVPNMLVASEAERGLGSVFVKVINVFSKKPIQNKVKELAEQFEKTQLEGYSGIYKLTNAFQLMPYTPLPIDTPYLLFIHGTASSTSGSFGGLKGSTEWEQIHLKYGDNVLAFQHETLTKSPLQNVLELIKQLPQKATLHIVSHSRGGIIGEILSRFGNSDDRNRGFDENEIKLLKAEDRDEDVTTINSISKELQKKKIVVEKFVRVACPAGGTTLASKRLNTYLNVIFNLIGYGTGIGATPGYIALKNLITAVLESKDKSDVLPGLEAQKPSSPFMKVLNNPSSKVILDNQLAVVSGNCKVKANLKALLIILSKVFFLRDNDLVVDTHSMYMGSKKGSSCAIFF